MPIVATPVTPTALTRDQIRRFLRDYAGPVPNTGQLNVALDNVEFSEDDVDDAVRLTTSLFNTLTPVSGYTEATVPAILMLYGATSHLLCSESTRQLRNQMSGPAGDGAPIGLDDKHTLYQAACAYYREQFMELAKAFKTQRNMEGAWGHLSSGYLATSRNIYG